MIFENLNGLRVMVVEDEPLVSMLIEDTLADQGCIIVGPFTTVADALEGARNAEIDLALLDVNLRGVKVYPVAEVLAEQKVPFLLLSGYGENAVPREHPEWRAFGKPFEPDQLCRALAAQIPSDAGPPRTE